MPNRFPTETVVTAFPQRWKGTRPSPYPIKAEEQQLWDINMPDFSERIFYTIRTSDVEVKCPTDLVCLIIDKCSGLFHPRFYEADHTLDYLDVFAIEIGRLVRMKFVRYSFLLTVMQ